MPRDNQRRRLYRAEFATFMVDDEGPIPLELRLARQHFGEDPEKPVQAYVDRVLAAPGWAWAWDPRRGTPRVRVEVTHRGGRRRGVMLDDGTMLLPLWACMPYYVLHELSHYASEGRPSHGIAFAGCYAYLVRQFVGHVAADKLLREFGRRRVQWGDFRRWERRR